MDYPCMYLCIYFYKSCTKVCVQIYDQKPMDVTGFLLVFLFLRQYCYILLLKQNSSVTRCNL